MMISAAQNCRCAHPGVWLKSMITMSSEERCSYFRQLLPYLKASLAIFATGFLIGLVIVSHFPEIADRFESSVVGFIKIFRGLSKFQLAAAIFLNNALKTLFAIVLGSLIAIIPVTFLLANGIALGVVFSLSIKARGLWLSLLSIAPHGVLELPAVFLGTSIGIMIGAKVIKQLFERAETSVASEVVRGLRFFVTVILPLLFGAALVEAFVTSALVAPR
jgi:stage II sporulation protein M